MGLRGWTLAFGSLVLATGVGGVAVGAGAAPAARVQSVRVTAGYVVPPLWAAVVHGRLTTLGYTRVPSARVGGWGGPAGTYAQVPTSVRARAGKGWTTLYAVPRGDAILAVAGADDGVVVAVGRIADLARLPSATAAWTVVTVAARGHATAVWRSPSNESYRSVPLLAATGARWAAIAAVGRHGRPQAADLAVGRFGVGSAAHVAASTTAVATQLVVGPSGGVAVAYPAGVRVPRFPRGADVRAVSGSVYLLALPGGFGALHAGDLKVLGAGRERWAGRVALGASLVGGSADGVSAAVVTLSGSRTRAVWTYGPLPPDVRAVLSQASEALAVTAGGVAAVRFTGNGRRESVYAVWVVRAAR